MDWYDVDDILFDGTEEQIKAVRCPECGGHIRYRHGDGDFWIFCDQCGYGSHGHGGPEPNCVRFFGKEATI